MLRSTYSIVAGLMLIASIGPGCAPPEADFNKLALAQNLANAGQWDECIPVVKDFLTLAPYDSAGHALLGRAFLHGTDLQLMMAQGEFNAALELLRVQRKTGKLQQRPLDEGLELSITEEMALLHFTWVSLYIDQGGQDKEEIESHLESCHTFIEYSLRLDAESVRIKALNSRLVRLEKRLGIPERIRA